MINRNDSGLHRRLFLERCAASAFGLSLLPLTQKLASAASNSESNSSESGFGKARHVIFIMLGGGLTQIDTFDPKAGDGKGPYERIQNSAGGHFTDCIPQIAKVADKMTVIRSMTANIGTHREASYFMRTAFREINTIKHPMLGAWAQRVLGRSHDILPSTVSINRDAGYGNGFLPSTMSPLPILDPEAGLQNLEPEHGLEEIRDRLAKLDKLDSAFRERYPDRNIKAYSDFYDDSVRLMGGKEGKAFDLTRESDAMRDAYGRTQFGQGCLLARRLVETGVRFVEVQFGGWDMHKTLIQGLQEVGPVLDQVYAQLLRDLDERGLLADTLVVMATEFGRTPNISNGGRNHFPPAFTCTLAGGGVKGGLIHGATDDKGAEVTQSPVTPGELHATIGWAMGIRPDDEILAPNGRPFTIGDKSQPVLDVFA